jgi:hypothetical protein
MIVPWLLRIKIVRWVLHAQLSIMVSVAGSPLSVMQSLGTASMITPVGAVGLAIGIAVLAGPTIVKRCNEAVAARRGAAKGASSGSRADNDHKNVEGLDNDGHEVAAQDIQRSVGCQCPEIDELCSGICESCMDAAMEDDLPVDDIHFTGSPAMLHSVTVRSTSTQTAMVCRQVSS